MTDEEKFRRAVALLRRHRYHEVADKIEETRLWEKKP